MCDPIDKIQNDKVQNNKISILPNRKILKKIIYCNYFNNYFIWFNFLYHKHNIV